MLKIIFSGVQPSGNLHLGNYLGALKNWVALQQDYRCIFCVVDYHAITVKQDPQELRKKIVEIAKLYLAAGINPETAIIFQQSAVSEHTELAWVLNTCAYMGELFSMTQFKDKAHIDFDELKKQLEQCTDIAPMYGGAIPIPSKINSIFKFNKIGVGLFDYPVLMAADILLYNADLVPVGDDQSQHVELTRTLARRFNSQYGETLKVPEAFIQKQGARIMGFDDPSKKMSKSAASNLNYIALLDKPEAARKKIMKAVTDTGKEVRFDEKQKPAISNLLTIYSLLANSAVQDLEKTWLT